MESFLQIMSLLSYFWLRKITANFLNDHRELPRRSSLITNQTS
jgi:hypothetical protein